MSVIPTFSQLEDKYNYLEKTFRLRELRLMRHAERLLRKYGFDRKDIEDNHSVIVELHKYSLLSYDDRLDVEKNLRLMLIEKHTCFINRLKILLEDPEFGGYIIDLSGNWRVVDIIRTDIKNHTKLLEYLKNNTRAGEIKGLRRAIFKLIFILCKKNFIQKKQLDLLYDLFCHYNFDNCRNKIPDSVRESLRVDYQQPAAQMFEELETPHTFIPDLDDPEFLEKYFKFYEVIPDEMLPTHIL